MIPVESDTPPDHQVIGLRLDPDTLPEWWERIVALAPAWVRRMAVVENPEAWYVKVEVHRDRVEAFHEALAEAWRVYQEDVAAGRVATRPPGT